MSRYGQRIGQDAVRFTRTLPGPIERVWDYLVDGEKRGQWFCGGTTGADVGEPIDLVFEHGDLSPLPDDPPPEKHEKHGTRIEMKADVIRSEKPHAFAFLWHGPDEESEVLYELTTEGDDVRFVLTHTRLRTREDVLGVLAGWHAHLDILEDVMNGTVPEPFWRRFTPLDSEYDSRIEAS